MGIYASGSSTRYSGNPEVREATNKSLTFVDAAEPVRRRCLRERAVSRERPVSSSTKV